MSFPLHWRFGFLFGILILSINGGDSWRLFKPINSRISGEHVPSWPLAALKDGVDIKIDELRQQLASLESSDLLKKEINLILQSYDALESINRDIEMLAMEIADESKPSKQSVVALKAEFETCRESIEDELNALL